MNQKYYYLGIGAQYEDVVVLRFSDHDDPRLSNLEGDSDVLFGWLTADRSMHDGCGYIQKPIQPGMKPYLVHVAYCEQLVGPTDSSVAAVVFVPEHVIDYCEIVL